MLLRNKAKVPLAQHIENVGVSARSIVSDSRVQVSGGRAQ